MVNKVGIFYRGSVCRVLWGVIVLGSGECFLFRLVVFLCIFKFFFILIFRLMSFFNVLGYLLVLGSSFGFYIFEVLGV